METALKLYELQTSNIMNKILDHVHCLDDDGLDKEP